MKIVFVLSSFKFSGGVSVVIEYANRLVSRGHEVTLVAPGGTLSSDIAITISPAVKIIETKALFPRTSNAFGKLCITVELTKLVPKADVIIATHTPTTAVTLFTGKILKKGVPLWFFQDYPGMFSGKALETFLLRNALIWHRGVLTISGFSKKILERKYPSKKIIIVGEGLSNEDILKPITPQDRLLTKPPCATVFFLGDTRPRKGMNDFLDAIDRVKKHIPDVHVWIASKERCEINTDVPYTFYEHPNTKELWKLYASCDVFVSASWWEGFGLPPLEAMACGAPVVTTDSIGIREYARDRENCLIVPPRDPKKLSLAIIKLLTDKDLAQTLRKHGPETAALFKWQYAVERFEFALNTFLK